MDSNEDVQNCKSEPTKMQTTQSFGAAEVPTENVPPPSTVSSGAPPPQKGTSRAVTTSRYETNEDSEKVLGAVEVSPESKVSTIRTEDKRLHFAATRPPPASPNLICLDVDEQNQRMWEPIVLRLPTVPIEVTVFPGAERVSGITSVDDEMGTTRLFDGNDNNEGASRPTFVDAMARAVLVDEPVVASVVGRDDTAEARGHQSHQESGHKRGQQRLVVSLVSMVLAMAVAIAVVVSVFVRRDHGGSGSNPEIASTPPAEWSSLIRSRSPYTTFTDDTSPQTLALDWLVQDSFTLSLNDDERVVQRFALAVMFISKGSPTSWNLGGDEWLSPSAECGWGSLQCTSEPTVVDFMNLPEDDLLGTIPPEIGLMSHLILLHFPANKLYGTIPTEIGLLSRMVSMELQNNTLEGPIPTEMGQLSAFLTWLHLDSNKLEGTIPTEVGFLTKLTFLDLTANSLEVPIPTEIVLLKELSLYLGLNKLEGLIPTEIGLMTNLARLELQLNNLEGSIPSELGLLSVSLKLLYLGFNNLEGTIPSEVGLMTSLVELDLPANSKLSGSVPSELANLTNLEGLWLFDTQLSGSIPSNLCASKLTWAPIDCGEIECDCCTPGNWEDEEFVPC